MKLEKILLMGAMPLALLFSGCSQNVNVTNNQVNQSGSGSVTISNETRQKQEISVNNGSKKFNYNYCYDEIPGVLVLSDTKNIGIQINSSHEFMVMQSGTNEKYWKNFLTDTVPGNYQKQFFDYSSTGLDYGKVAVYYSSKWKLIDFGGNATPTFLFREKGFE